jgi:hypothetical protein
MLQLEFDNMIEGLPVSVAPAKPGKVKATLLGFLRLMVVRKFGKRFSDLDVLVLVSLAHAAEPRRFSRVVEDCGASQSGVWNSLERLTDFDLVDCGGPPGKHVYRLTGDGVRELKKLVGK